MEHISVIIPTFNRRVLLARCVESILAQTVAPFEVIVVDDGSDDGTGDALASRFGKDVKYLRLEHRGLPSVARNAGIDESRGTHIAFCDSDDCWLRHKLEWQLVRLKEYACNFSCSDAYVDREGGPLYLNHYAFTGRTLQHDLLRENLVITSSVLVERRIIGNKRFSTSPRLRGYEDYDYWLSLAPSLCIDFVPQPLLVYQRHAGSLSDELKQQDAMTQLRILFSNPAYVSHPIIWAKKVIRTVYHLLP